MTCGGIEFKTKGRDDQAECELIGADTFPGKAAGKWMISSGLATKMFFSGAFMIDAFQMIKVFCKPRIKVGTEWVIKGQTCDQVRNHIFMMRKALMGSLGDNQFGRYIFRYISLIFNFIFYTYFFSYFNFLYYYTSPERPFRCLDFSICQATGAVGGIARAIFDRLFKWLIEKCNDTLIGILQKYPRYVSTLSIVRSHPEEGKLLRCARHRWI